MKASFPHFLLALGLALPGTAVAQTELGNFSAVGRGGVINTFAQGYQAIGINPANLGRSGAPLVSFTIGEFGAGAASRTLTKDIFKNIITSDSQPLTPGQRTELVNALSGPDVLNLNLDGTTLGLAVSLPNGLGGIAISNRLRNSLHLGLNPNAADILVNGQNAAIVKQYYPTPNTGSTPTPTNPNAPLVSTVLDGTSIQLASTSEYSLSYGVEVLSKDALHISVGAGYRYIQGLGIVDVRAESGSLYAFTALSPVFDIDYGALSANPNFNSVRESGLFKSVGSGNGFDLGVAVEAGKGLRFGASVTDLGNMTWTGNVVTANDQRLQQLQSQGATTYDIFSSLADQFDTDKQTLFTYEAAKERKAALPGKFRFGAGMRVSNLLEVGLDVTTPLNKVAGNLTSPFVGVGVDFKPVSGVRLSSGVSGGAGYGTNLPLGITFVTSVWEAGFSTRDVLGLYSDKSPYYSVATGILRFRFGGNKEEQ
ncbi:DUF5723 family protein [Hymenobacter armeniacus]|uniref:DUF5723 domain-containing protein n=1 Tax=Hymenobacter armeniacus TaxID=2771358 RepID=A0ABR8JW61_9BACT|nr:DUF5723 family protein [Hymenobacter armeniacus]MBD2724200.1 hypothetical protein [Hymenobacter armeniacus]